MLLNKKVLIVLLLPGLLLYMFFVLIPVISTFAFSFTNMSGVRQDFIFTGLDNWKTALGDQRLMNSIKLTFLFVFFCTICTNLIGLIAAYILDSSIGKRLASISRTLFFLPTVLTPVVIGFVWYYIYKMGIPSVLGLLGFPEASKIELIGTDTSLLCVSIVTIWLQMGTAMIIYVAAIGGIPGEVYESATIDGANRFKTFSRITIPLIIPAFLINIVNSLIVGFRQFDQILAMTKGGPGNSSETLCLFIYYNAMTRSDYGYACTISTILFAIVMVLLIVLVNFFKSREVNG
jgi:ABC-type sugar transport systems, permease components